MTTQPAAGIDQTEAVHPVTRIEAKPTRFGVGDPLGRPVPAKLRSRGRSNEN